MPDALLERIAYRAEAPKFTPIPWPENLEPKLVKVNRDPNGPLPKADIVVSAFTFAEGQALAAVLSPGFGIDDWIYYRHLWASYEDQLTDRSPAKESKRLGSYSLITINGKRVLLFKFELHPATDGPSVPTAQLWRQIASETGASLLITHGTAGGCAGLELGDVSVATDFTWNCQKEFRSESWAHTSYSAPAFVAGQHVLVTAPSLMTVNAEPLRKYATRDPKVILGKSVESIDYFGFYDFPSDTFGILKADPSAAVEEMDDCACPMGLQSLDNPPAYLSIRNASDPPVPDSVGDIEAQTKWAAAIYRDLGFVTTVESSIVCWAVIADL